MHPFIAERAIPEPNTGCALWAMSCFYNGYGQTKHPRTHRVMGAHRLSWELSNGPIPTGLQVCHKCDVPSCVNPDHLFLGTPKDNMADRGRKGRQHRPMGELQGSHKLTHEQAVTILSEQRPLRLKKANELAEAFGITVAHVYRVRRGERWSHLKAA